MINQTIVIGNLGNDPVLHYSPDGTPVATLDIAFNSSKKKTCWIKVVAFRILAETIAKYLRKGNRVGVLGTLDSQKWTDKEGQNHSSYQIIANNIEFIKVDESVFKDGEVTPETINDETPF